MLTQLLELLRAGGTHRVADLVRELDATSELIEAMLEYLGWMGHLKRVGGACAGKCTACPVAGLCAAGEGGRVWVLTD